MVIEADVDQAVERVKLFERETNPKVEAYVRDNADLVETNPEAVIKAMDAFLTEFGESIGITKHSEKPIIEVSGDPIQAALQIRGFYIGVIAAQTAHARANTESNAPETP